MFGFATTEPVLICITSTHVDILQSLVFKMYPYPLCPQLIPHEFLINQCVELYPTSKTA